MAATFPKGAAVRQIVKPIEGVIAGYQVDTETGDLQFLVEYTDDAGQPHARYFTEAELEAV